MPGIFTTPVVRKLINQFLIGDSQLEAFVLDYFPHVKHLYGNSMDRTAKVNLLLEQVNCDQIYANLCRHCPEAVNQTKINNFRDAQNRSNTPNAENVVANHEECSIRYFLVLTGTIDELDEPKIRALVSHIRRLSGDIELTLEAIKSGSIVLHLKGTSEGLKRLRSAFHSGVLSEILGFKLEDIREGSSGVEDEKDLTGPHASNYARSEFEESLNIFESNLSNFGEIMNKYPQMMTAYTNSSRPANGPSMEIVTLEPLENNQPPDPLPNSINWKSRGSILMAAALIGFLVAALIGILFH